MLADPHLPLVAEDDYKELFFKYRKLKKQDLGPGLEKREQLKDKLQCKSFSWFLKEVCPGAQPRIHPFTRPMAFRTFRTMAFQLASLEPAPGAGGLINLPPRTLARMKKIPGIHMTPLSYKDFRMRLMEFPEPPAWGRLFMLAPRTMALGFEAAKRLREGFAFVGILEERGGTEMFAVLRFC
eukprot:g9773.t1